MSEQLAFTDRKSNISNQQLRLHLCAFLFLFLSQKRNHGHYLIVSAHPMVIWWTGAAGLKCKCRRWPPSCWPSDQQSEAKRQKNFLVQNGTFTWSCLNFFRIYKFLFCFTEMSNLLSQRRKLTATVLTFSVIGRKLLSFFSSTKDILAAMVANFLCAGLWTLSMVIWLNGFMDGGSNSPSFIRL